MKKNIPTPVVIAAIAFVVVLGAFLFWKGLQGPSELPRAPITVGKDAVPDYMKDKMSPEMQKMIDEQSKKYGAQQGSSDSSTSQPAPGR